MSRLSTDAHTECEDRARILKQNSQLYIRNVDMLRSFHIVHSTVFHLYARDVQCAIVKKSLQKPLCKNSCFQLTHFCHESTLCITHPKFGWNLPSFRFVRILNRAHNVPLLYMDIHRQAEIAYLRFCGTGQFVRTHTCLHSWCVQACKLQLHVYINTNTNTVVKKTAVQISCSVTDLQIGRCNERPVHTCPSTVPLPPTGPWTNHQEVKVPRAPWQIQIETQLGPPNHWHQLGVIYANTNIQIYKYTNIQIYKYTNIQIYKYTYKIQIQNTNTKAEASSDVPWNVLKAQSCPVSPYQGIKRVSSTNTGRSQMYLRNTKYRFKPLFARAATASLPSSEED